MSCMASHWTKQPKSALLFHQQAKPDQSRHTKYINRYVQGLWYQLENSVSMLTPDTLPESSIISFDTYRTQQKLLDLIKYKIISIRKLHEMILVQWTSTRLAN